MTKQKEIMKRSGLLQFFLKDKTATEKNYITQGNFCKNFSKMLKSHVLALSISKIINDNRTFWKSILAHFTQKVSKDEKINITKREVISNDKKFALLLTNVLKILCLI